MKRLYIAIQVKRDCQRCYLIMGLWMCNSLLPDDMIVKCQSRTSASTKGGATPTSSRQRTPPSRSQYA